MKLEPLVHASHNLVGHDACGLDSCREYTLVRHVGSYTTLPPCASDMRRLPAEDANDAVLFEKIKSGKYDDGDPVWESISSGAKDLISKMLDVDASVRPSAGECLQHPWLQQQIRAFAVQRPTDAAAAAAATSARAPTARQIASVSRLLSSRVMNRIEVERSAAAADDRAGTNGAAAGAADAQAAAAEGTAAAVAAAAARSGASSNQLAVAAMQDTHGPAAPAAVPAGAQHAAQGSTDADRAQGGNVLPADAAASASTQTQTQAQQLHAAGQLPVPHATPQQVLDTQQAAASWQHQQLHSSGTAAPGHLHGQQAHLVAMQGQRQAQAPATSNEVAMPAHDAGSGRAGQAANGNVGQEQGDDDDEDTDDDEETRDLASYL